MVMLGLACAVGTPGVDMAAESFGEAGTVRTVPDGTRAEAGLRRREALNGQVSDGAAFGQQRGVPPGPRRGLEDTVAVADVELPEHGTDKTEDRGARQRSSPRCPAVNTPLGERRAQSPAHKLACCLTSKYACVKAGGPPGTRWQRVPRLAASRGTARPVPAGDQHRQ